MGFTNVGIWNVLYDFSFVDMVAARRVNVHHQDHDLRRVVLRDLRRTVILEIKNGNDILI